MPAIWNNAIRQIKDESTMRKLFFPLITVILVTGATAASAQDGDFLIVPGERVGRITADASEDSLRTIYGDDRVEPALVAMGEGFVCKGSRILFDNDEFLEITWLDTEAKTAPAAVYVNGASWRTGDGIGLGISLRELEAINGKPFRLAGFSWDYGGTIISWGSGRLEDRIPKTLLVLIPDGEAYERVGPEAGQVDGDIEFSSGHPVMQKLNPLLVRLGVILDPENKRCNSFEGPQ
jgi:hypothetical protein